MNSDLGYLASNLSKHLRSTFAVRIHGSGLTSTQAAVVLGLQEGERAKLSEIADRMGIDRPTMTGMAERMSRDGWIDIAENPDDKRSRLVSLTPKAIEVQPALVAASREVTEIALGGFSAKEREAFGEMLVRATANLEQR